MSVSSLRYALCCALIALVPVRYGLGQDLPSGQLAGAILHAQGGVWVNGAEARDSLAVLPGDLIETKSGFSANLSLDGSTVSIGPESITKFQNDYIELDHGRVAVVTSKGYKVYVNCIRVVPVLNAWTNYEVTDVSRSIDVAASKNDVNVEHETARKKTAPGEGGERASVHEGEEHSYDETELCGAAEIASPGGPLSPKWIAAEAGGGAAIICLFVCKGHGGPPKNPISPDTP